MVKILGLNIMLYLINVVFIMCMVIIDIIIFFMIVLILKLV